MIGGSPPLTSHPLTSPPRKLSLLVQVPYRKPAFQPSAFRQLFIGFQPSAEKKLIYTRVNILDLKILQVFFKNRGEILVF